MMDGHVLVVGAGIVGLSTAYWLAKSGAKVSVIEQGPVPNPVASSTDHHRLIRYFYGDSDGYCARMAEGYAAWREMWDDLPGEESHYYAATGMLAVSQEAGDYTDRSRLGMERAGIPFERIDGTAELARRFPFLEAANLSYGMLAEGGALMANRILADLALWLRRAGVSILEFSPVASVDAEGAGVQLADGRRLSADRVVVTAGISTADLMPELALPLQPVRTVIAYVDPPEDLAGAYATMPCWTDLGGATDLWGMPGIDGLPMKLGDGSLRRDDAEPDDRTMTEAELRIMLGNYATRFRGADRFRVRWRQANFWTQAPAGKFLLADHGPTLAVSACSGHGFKFGALSGRDVAEAVAGARPVEAVRQRLAADAV